MPSFVAQALVKSGKISEKLFNQFTTSQIHWAKGESLDTINESLQQILDRCEVEIASVEQVNERQTAKFIQFTPRNWDSDKPTLH